MSVETTKLDELFRKLPVNSGLDPMLVEAAKTELNVLKFRAGVYVQTHKQKIWSKSSVEQLQDQIQDKDTEILLLRRQLQDRNKFPNDGGTVSRKPDQIKEQYMSLYDNEWVTVYQYFKQNGWTEVEIVVTLQRILRASYAFCKDVAIEQLENIEGEALYPTATWMDDDCIITRMKHKQISREISELAKMYQRTTAQECLSALQKTFIESVLPTFIDPSKYKHRCITNYTSHCVDLTWSMCVQDPPMVFIDKLDRGADFNTDQFRKFTRSGGNKFDYLVWPALRLYHNGPLIVKGIAEPIKVPKRATPDTQIKPEVQKPEVVVLPQTPPRDASNLVTPPRDGRSPVAKSRNPEDWVDLDMNSEDNNSWDRDIPQTPSKVYKRAQPKANGGPSTPYFAPYTNREKTDIPTITIQQPGEATRGRYARSQDGKPYEQHPGNLTVLWKNQQPTRQDRRTSAP